MKPFAKVKKIKAVGSSYGKQVTLFTRLIEIQDIVKTTFVQDAKGNCFKSDEIEWLYRRLVKPEDLKGGFDFRHYNLIFDYPEYENNSYCEIFGIKDNIAFVDCESSYTYFSHSVEELKEIARIVNKEIKARYTKFKKEHPEIYECKNKT